MPKYAVMIKAQSAGGSPPIQDTEVTSRAVTAANWFAAVEKVCTTYGLNPLTIPLTRLEVSKTGD